LIVFVDILLRYLKLMVALWC